MLKRLRSSISKKDLDAIEIMVSDSNVESLSITVKNLFNENLKLNRTVEEYEKTIDSLKSKLSFKLSELDKFKQSNKISQKQIKQLKKEIGELNITLSDTLDRAEKSRHLEFLRANRYRKEINKLMDDVRSRDGSHINIVKDLNNISNFGIDVIAEEMSGEDLNLIVERDKKIEELTSTIKDLQSDTEKLRAEKDNLLNDLVKNKTSALHPVMIDHSGSIADMENNLELMISEKERLTDENKRLLRKLDTGKMSYEVLLEQLEAVENSKNEIELIFEKQKGRYDLANKQLVDLRQELNEVIKEKEELKRERDEFLGREIELAPWKHVERKPYEITIASDRKSGAPHLAVVGQGASGKTSYVKRVIEKSVMEAGASVFVFDRHHEYDDIGNLVVQFGDKRIDNVTEFIDTSGMMSTFKLTEIDEESGIWSTKSRIEKDVADNLTEILSLERKDIKVFWLDALSKTVNDLIINEILNRVVKSAHDSKLPRPVIIVVEDAERMAGNEWLSTIATEGVKFGIYLLSVSGRPMFDQTVIGNSQLFMFKMMPGDVDSVVGTVIREEYKRVIYNLGVGDFLAQEPFSDDWIIGSLENSPVQRDVNIESKKYVPERIK